MTYLIERNIDSNYEKYFDDDFTPEYWIYDTVAEKYRCICADKKTAECLIRFFELLTSINSIEYVGEK